MIEMPVKKNDNAIIVFTKLPIEGKVKTRLAKDTGESFAASLYKVCAEHTFNILSEFNTSSVQIFLFYPEESEIKDIKKWAGNKFCYYTQRGNDLGDKMYNAFKLVFEEGFKKVIIIGTDLPDINHEIIEKAFSYLETRDCVLGPSNDGGYYLLGFKKKVIDLFSGINWSTDSVLEKTEEQLTQIGTTYFLLNELVDIDTKEDLENWLTHFDGNENHPVKVFVDSEEKFFK
jgi:uncharacterized protein